MASKMFDADSDMGFGKLTGDAEKVLGEILHPEYGNALPVHPVEDMLFRAKRRFGSR